MAAPGHSSTTFVSSIIHRRGRTVFRCADPGSAGTGSPWESPARRNLVCAPPGPPCRAVLHRGAGRANTMLHPFCCVMTITVTCIGTDAALPCLEPLFEKPPWMKISSRTSQAVHNGCWPTGYGNDTQDAARHWQATPARPTHHLPRPGRPSASPSCRRIRHRRSDAQRVRANDSPRFFRRPTAPHAIRGKTPLRRCLVTTGNG